MGRGHRAPIGYRGSALGRSSRAVTHLMRQWPSPPRSSVVEPVGSGLGGGGFWLIHRARDGFQTMVDGRERAPLKAHKDMYLDDAGEVIRGASLNGPLAAGIPGEPAALAHIAQSYGRLPLSVSLRPAIELASGRFSGWRAISANGWNGGNRCSTRAGGSYSCVMGKPRRSGQWYRQPELAATLAGDIGERARWFLYGLGGKHAGQ